MRRGGGRRPAAAKPMPNRDKDTGSGSLTSMVRQRKPKAIGLQGVDEQSLVDLLRYGCTRRIQFKRQPVPVCAKSWIGF